MDTALRDKLAGRRVVASISGGKDSAALSLWLTEQGIDHDRVHLLTGWDADATMEYIRGPLTRAIGPIVEVEGPRLMEPLIDHKGMFPSKARRFCTEELKVLPMQRYLRARVDGGGSCRQCQGDPEGIRLTLGGEECGICGGTGINPAEDLINAVGIRHGESAARAAMPEWEWSDGFDCEVWRPLIHWAEQDVIAIHRRHGLAPNPLYLQGFERVGCFPCIYARKAEIRLIAERHPERIVRLRELEERTHLAARARWEARRDAWMALPIDERVNRRSPPFDKAKLPRGCRWVRGQKPVALPISKDSAGNGRPPKPYHRPAWFQAPIGGGGECWPIDRVVEWSRTTRGGRHEDRQVELFANHNPGCMRWGLCETGG